MHQTTQKSYLYGFDRMLAFKETPTKGQEKQQTILDAQITQNDLKTRMKQHTVSKWMFEWLRLTSNKLQDIKHLNFTLANIWQHTATSSHHATQNRSQQTDTKISFLKNRPRNL